MKISPLYAAWLATQAIYSQQGEFDKILTVGVDTIGIKTVAETMTITIMGTVDSAMWENNFEFVPFYHPLLGNMHGGFLKSAEEIYTILKTQITGCVTFQGHSRGAALANILASLCALDGIKVAQLFLFECPNVGYQRYADFCIEQIRNGNIGFDLSTVNGLDPVPYVPFDPYMPSYPRTDLDCAPGGVEDADMFDWHLSPAIYAGVQKMFPQSKV